MVKGLEVGTDITKLPSRSVEVPLDNPSIVTDTPERASFLLLRILPLIFEEVCAKDENEMREKTVGKMSRDILAIVVFIGTKLEVLCYAIITPILTKCYPSVTAM
jgi:hypothetical protein